MSRFKTIYYIAFIAVFLLGTACDKIIFDSQDDSSNSETPSVYLSVTRMQGSAPSLNEDDDDFEDRVHALALLVFDSVTKQKVAEYYDASIVATATNYGFTIKMNPGNRDFYFVANMPINNDIKSIENVDNMDSYMISLTDLDTDLYLGASTTKGFPMARVYKNEEVTEGGTINAPKEFKPGGNTHVELIRVTAKLEVVLDGTNDNLDIEEVKFHNAYRQFSLLAQNSPIANPTYYADAVMKQLAGTNTYIYYMPEALMSNPVWNTTGHKPVNYFSIKTKGGTTYKIPIITHDDSAIPGNNYMQFATGNHTEVPDYQIYRNHHYRYVIRNLENIEIDYTIDDWNVVPTALYMGYGYNVEIDPEGNIKITNTIDDCMPHLVELKAVGGATFSDNSTNVIYGYNSKEDIGFTEAQMKTGYSEGFELTNIPESGDYLEVHYNGIHVKTFSK